MTDRTDVATADGGGFSRRSLIKTSAGVATTAAITVAMPTATAAADAPAVAVATTTPIAADPVVAYIHDAARGEVTVVSKTSQRTFRDRVLVNRLLAAADATEGK